MQNKNFQPFTFEMIVHYSLKEIMRAKVIFKSKIQPLIIYNCNFETQGQSFQT